MKNYFCSENILLSELAHLNPSQNSAHRITCIIAIDEVGRGCIAGPVLSCASLWVLKETSFINLTKQRTWIPLIRDSKQLSPKKRKNCFDIILNDFSLKQEDIFPIYNDHLMPEHLVPSVPSAKHIHFDMPEILNSNYQFECVGFALGAANAKEVDKFNIWNCVQLAAGRALKTISKETKLSSYLNSALLLMDGKLKIKVPEEFKSNIQVTCIKADDKFVSVGFSSIIAKVVRDTFMEEQDIPFPAYLFSKHKGYGTAAHFQSIQKNGHCSLHRKSFLK